MKTLGVDFGVKRIGLACTDEDETIAVPFKVISLDSSDDPASIVAAEAKNIGAGQIVVGFPRRTDGQPSAMGELVESFMTRLRTLSGLRIIRQDEWFSTSSADRVLSETGVSGRKKKMVRDKLAAQVILDSWLSAKPSL